MPPGERGNADILKRVWPGQESQAPIKIGNSYQQATRGDLLTRSCVVFLTISMEGYLCIVANGHRQRVLRTARFHGDHLRVLIEVSHGHVSIKDYVAPLFDTSLAVFWGED